MNGLSFLYVYRINEAPPEEYWRTPSEVINRCPYLKKAIDKAVLEADAPFRKYGWNGESPILVAAIPNTKDAERGKQQAKFCVVCAVGVEPIGSDPQNEAEQAVQRPLEGIITLRKGKRTLLASPFELSWLTPFLL
jgi:hypothetical protein